MDEDTNNTTELTTHADEDDALLPDGWAEGNDIFDESTWTGAAKDTDEHPEQNSSALDTTTVETEPASATPTTEEPAAEDAKLGDAATAAPTTEPQQNSAPKRLKFKARVDHDDVDVDLDEAELPTIYQKAQVTERAQAKLEKINPVLSKLSQLTKAMGYDTDDAMLDGALDNLKSSKLEELTSKGTPEEIAKDYVERMFGGSAQVSNTKATPSSVKTEPENKSADRDFHGEVAELLQARPELKGKALPDEVIQAAVRGNQRLVSVYNDWIGKQREAELEALRKENNTLKQNAASAAKAPVKGVSKGGWPDNKPDDPFLKGFNSDDW